MSLLAQQNAIFQCFVKLFLSQRFQSPFVELFNGLDLVPGVFEKDASDILDPKTCILLNDWVIFRIQLQENRNFS